MLAADLLGRAHVYERVQPQGVEKFADEPRLYGTRIVDAEGSKLDIARKDTLPDGRVIELRVAQRLSNRKWHARYLLSIDGQPLSDFGRVGDATRAYESVVATPPASEKPSATSELLRRAGTARERISQPAARTTTPSDPPLPVQPDAGTVREPPMSPPVSPPPEFTPSPQAPRAIVDVPKLPPLEAIEFFRTRVPIESKTIERLVRMARERGMAVRERLTTDIREAMDQALVDALREGTGLPEFRRRFGEILATNGLDRANPFRVETIFRTNLTTAYTAGRLEQIESDPAVSEVFQWVQFDATIDGATTPVCRAMHGRVFRRDDPAFAMYHPPLHFN